MALFLEAEGESAAAFSSTGFGLDSLLEGAAAAAEWRELGTFQVDGSELTLSTATALVKVKAVRRSQKHCKFEAVFDKKKLVACGFHERIDLENMAKIIDSAMRGDASFSARIEADDDSVKLKMTQTIVPGFEMDYTLPLKRKRLDATDLLRAELAKLKTDSEAEIAQLRQIIEELKDENGALKERMEETERIAKKAAIAEETKESEIIADLRRTISDSKKRIGGLQTDLDSLRKATSASLVSASVDTKSDFRFGTSLEHGYSKPEVLERMKSKARVKRKQIGAKKVPVAEESKEAAKSIRSVATLSSGTQVTNDSFTVFDNAPDIVVKSVGANSLEICAGKRKTLLLGSTVEWNRGVCSYSVIVKEALKKTFAVGIIGDLEQCLKPKMYLTHDKLKTDAYVVQCYVRKSKGPSFFVVRNFRGKPPLKLTKKAAPLSVGSQVTIKMDFDEHMIEFVVNDAVVASEKVTSRCAVWHPAIDVDVAINVDIA